MVKVSLNVSATAPVAPPGGPCELNPLKGVAL
jgi:hypothetical protein